MRTETPRVSVSRAEGDKRSQGTVQVRSMEFEPESLILDQPPPEEVVTIILEEEMEMAVGKETQRVNREMFLWFHRKPIIVGVFLGIGPESPDHSLVMVTESQIP